MGLQTVGLFAVPTSVSGITPLVSRVQIESEAYRAGGKYSTVYVFHNQPRAGSLYEPIEQRLLPLDSAWQKGLSEVAWPSKTIPQVIRKGEKIESLLVALVSEYLFISLFRACAESLASENASRLASMQRADKNIDDLMETLNSKAHRLRQSKIDEELFDVVSGYEALTEKV